MLADQALVGRDLVFVGDYVNRGPESRAVVNTLIDLRHTWPASICFLRGNHDEALLDVLRGGPIAPLLLMGGSATIRSWVPNVSGDVRLALQQEVTDEEVDFFESLVDFWSAGDVVATHARPSDGQDTTPTRELLVVGHYIQQDASPRIVDGCAYLDTGCGSLPHGRLSALLLPERTFVSH